MKEELTSFIDPQTKIKFSAPGRFALVEAFSQDYLEEPPDDESLDNYQAHPASNLIYRMELCRNEDDQPLLYIIHLETMLIAPAAVIPYDLKADPPLDWLVIATREERAGIFVDNMKELVQNDTNI